MAAGGGSFQNGHDDAPGGADLYAVLGLKKECTDAELKASYRRLAMIWHPDRCSAAGSSARVEEAKERFQEIQEAYSVLSDSNKRFLYDVGVYDNEDDDDDLSGMGNFLGEMADMMSQATPTESFEELQQLFVDMFQDDIMAAGAGICGRPPPPLPGQQRARSQSSACTSSLPPSRPPPPRTRDGVGIERGSSAAVGSGKPPSRPAGRAAGLSHGLGLSGFCFKVSETRPAPWTYEYDVSRGGKGRSCRKQRLSTSRDVSDGLSRQSRAS